MMAGRMGDVDGFDRGLFVKVCGRLGSDADGERAAAARKASQMLSNAGLTWADVLSGEPLGAREARPEKTRRYGRWRACDVVTALWEHEVELNEYQRAFIVGQLPAVQKYGPSYFLSPKQWRLLVEWADDLGLEAP